MRTRLAVVVLLLVGPAAAALADPLASEKIRGDVLVGGGQDLYSSAAAAQAHASDALSTNDPVALRVIADHGDTIEVETVHVEDCVPSRQTPYKLTVFAARAVLIPRTSGAIGKVYPDGTAVQIEVGAPVVRAPLGWRDEMFAATDVAPSASQLAYGTPAGGKPRALPAPAGEELVCDPEPQTRAAWHTAQQRTNAARAAERQRERDAARAKHAKSTKKAPATAQEKREQEAQTLADLLTGDGGDYARDELLDQATDGAADRYTPPCGIADPSRAWDAPAGAAKTPLPTVGGRAIPWPSRQTRDAHVYETGAELRADLGLTCGHLQLAVARAGVTRNNGGGSVGVGGNPHVWTPKPGRVVWADGRAAGSYSGSERYTDDQVEVTGDLVCVRVGGIAEKVCHHLADVKH